MAACYHDGKKGFHEIGKSNNGLTKKQIESYKRQIQVIDETMNEQEMEAYIKENEGQGITFAEPQSMNF